MSPILVRPVREQLEHDRVIRLLQAKYKRKFDVAINPGHEQTVPVAGRDRRRGTRTSCCSRPTAARKLLGTVEVETAESVNNLEAMSQWATFSRLRAPFHLYVPASNIDTAKRLCTDLQIAAAEIWAYNALGDQMRFTLVHRSASRSPEPKARARGTAPGRRGSPPERARRPAGAARPAAGRRRRRAARPPPRRAAHAAAAARKKTAARPSRTQKRK